MKDLTPHPQADILRAIADGKTVQIRHEDDDAWWEPTDALQYINSDKHKFRIKPETITINGIEVPCPVREQLKDGQEFYVADVTQTRRPVRFHWDSVSDAMQCWFKRRLIHLTEEAAIAHTEALLSFTRSDK